MEPTAATEIEQPSSIMVDKITTMPRGNVRDRLGRITDADVIGSTVRSWCFSGWPDDGIGSVGKPRRGKECAIRDSNLEPADEESRPIEPAEW